eukprot:440665_1
MWNGKIHLEIFTNQMVQIQSIDPKKYHMNQLLLIFMVVILVMHDMIRAKYFGVIQIECCSMEMKFRAIGIAYTYTETRYHGIEIKDNDTEIICYDTNRKNAMERQETKLKN